MDTASLNDHDPDFLLQQALETLAGNASVHNEPNVGDVVESNSETVGQTAARWQTLFSLRQDTAIETLIAHRQNLTRTRVSDEHWNTVRAEKEAAGYDREAYESELELAKRKVAADPVPAAEGGAGVSYLVELSGPLETAESVREACGVGAVPEVVSGRSVEEGRRVELCCIDEAAKGALLRWAVQRGGGWEPTILADPRSLR